MKKVSLILGFAIIAGFLSSPLMGQSFIGGVIYQDLDLIAEESPYIVTENLIIADSVVLTINPGVKVFFEEGTAFKSLGAIQALGTAQAPITFNRREGTAEAWGGITLLTQNEQDTVPDVFKYCHFYNVSSSVLISYQRKDLVVENCLFTDNPNFTIKLLDNSLASVRNNEIRNCGYGVYMSTTNTSESNVVEGNIIDNLSSVGILIFGQNGLTARNQFIKNEISDCLYGIQVSGGEKTSGNIFSENIIRGNEAGMLIRNGYNEISSNTISNNLEGIKLMGDNSAGGKHNQIFNNLIHHNGTAIVLEEKSVENTLRGNSLFNNLIGLDFHNQKVLDEKGNVVVENVFYDNDSASVIIKESPQDSIAFNDFLDIGYPMFYLLNEPDQKATQNWWGSSDAEEIQQKVFDTHDNENMGEVLVQPFLQEPVSLLPAQPVNARKQSVLDTLIVSWESPANTGDIVGYRVYYKANDNYVFDEVYSVGDTTVFKLPGKNISEKVAVTSINEQADGQYDQHQRNECWFVFAEPYPFAGADKQSCEGDFLAFDDATAFGYDSIKWVSSGQGFFISDSVVQAEYLHGDEDLGDTVRFWLYQYQAGQPKIDSLEVYFSAFPEVQAGADTSIFVDSTLRTVQAAVWHTDSVKWTTEGDGYFTYPDSLITDYFPGSQDQESGEVDIILAGMGGCGQVVDTLRLSVIPSYSVSGTADINGIATGEVRVFANNPEQVKQLAAQNLGNESHFFFGGIPASECHLLYVPAQGSGYLPTYYVNSTRWEEAYLLSVDADVYDIDIQVQKPKYSLPHGEASLTGEVKLLNEINGVPPIVHLTDTSANIIQWEIPGSDGQFRFEDLPFGNYRLGIEKVGVPYFLSTIFTLSPDTPAIDNIGITIDGKEVAAFVEEPLPAIVAYPTVAEQHITLVFRDDQEAANVFIVSLEGQMLQKQSIENIRKGESHRIKTGNLPQGMYLLKVKIGDKNIFTKKILRF